jgi:hypothetical protein
MAKAFAYQTYANGPFAYTQVSDADCDAQYASAVASGQLTNGLPVVAAIEYPNATLNATHTAIATSTGVPTFWYQQVAVPASPGNAPDIIYPIVLANGANSNIPINGANFLRIVGPTGGFSVSGFTAGVDGQRLLIYNTVDQTMTITHDATSATGNKILCASGVDIVLQTSLPSFAEFVYSVIDNHWICTNPFATPILS